MSFSTSTPPPPTSPSTPSFPTTPYTPISPTSPFPYSPSDFHRADESPDAGFYAAPRFVTHIDSHAISLLKKYYTENLPKQGRVLDLCSSWVSHFPPELEERAVAARKTKEKEKVKDEKKRDGSAVNRGNAEADEEGGQEQLHGKEEREGEGLEVIGLGMSHPELSTNPILSTTILQNLNTHPTLPASLSPLHATVCVVSIDYLTQPVEVLSSLRDRTVEGGRVHLVVSNRCFPTKAVGRWLKISEEERLRMVGDYLWWSGWRGVEIVEVCDGRVRDGEDGGGGGGLARFMGMFGGVDPLWVVRGVKVAQ